MQITVVRPAELGPQEVAAWHRLQRQSEALASPFLCPEFAVAVGDCNPSARVAVLADGGQLTGFFPFEQRRFGLGAPIGAGLNDSQGLIHAPGTDFDPRQLLRGCGLSEWKFDHLVEGEQSFAPYVTVVSSSPVIDLSDGFAAYAGQLQARSPQFCRDTARKARKLEREQGELRLDADSRDLPELRALMAWKSDQYRRNGWVDVFDRQWIAELVERLFATRTATFEGLLSVLYAQDKPVAAHFGLRAGPVLAGWFPAYDARFARHSPGLIHHLRMAEQTSALGVKLIDMGTGTERYKQTLRSRDLMVAEGVVTRGPVAAGAHRLRAACGRWARQQARRHPPLFRAANRVLRHYGRVALCTPASSPLPRSSLPTREPGGAWPRPRSSPTRSTSPISCCPPAAACATDVGLALWRLRRRAPSTPCCRCPGRPCPTLSWLRSSRGAPQGMVTSGSMLAAAHRAGCAIRQRDGHAIYQHPGLYQATLRARSALRQLPR